MEKCFYHARTSNCVGDLPLNLEMAKIYADYTRCLHSYNAVDFDDLILKPVLLFQSNPDVLTKWQNRIRYLLVDEYQDTNLTQYQLVKLLVGTLAKFTVVGDDDQSIYAWRGAQPENLAQLQTDFPRLNVIKLEQNYRSTGRILKVANQLISNNPHTFEKRLWSQLEHGEPLRVLAHRNDEVEATQVVSEIMHHKLINGAIYKDYAILYRGNHQSRLIEQALRERNVPYFISGGTSFFVCRSERCVELFTITFKSGRRCRIFTNCKYATPRNWCDNIGKIGRVCPRKASQFIFSVWRNRFKFAFARCATKTLTNFS